MEPLEWIHSLISLDTMHVRPGPKFCDEEGYDIHPLNMISLVESDELEINIPHLLLDEVLVESVFPDTPSPRSKKIELEEEVSDEDWEVPKEELDKVRLLLKNRESANISINPGKKPRHFCKSHKRQGKQTTPRGESKEQNGEAKPVPDPPHLEGKLEYLCYVGAEDCVNMEQ